ncbi:MAG: hypothetical protein LBR47_04105 [Spirochaetaceae bacterium]|jgi:electron transport complex protein RnfC|nr:hypothetical protein [Spirochaetaceae bacterium]
MAGLYSIKRGSLKIWDTAVRYTEVLNAFLPSRALVSFKQQTGAAASPGIFPGQRVQEGQLIGVSSDAAARIHSPIPGIIRELRTTLMPNGKKELVAVIDLEGRFSILGKKPEELSWKYRSDAELISQISERGIINTFDSPCPLAVQIQNTRKKRSSAQKGIGSLLVRLFDSDPTYSTDEFLARTRFDGILQGAAITAKAMGASRIVLAYAAKKWFGPPEEKLKNFFPGKDTIDVQLVNAESARYPCGDGRELINLVNRIGKKAEKPLFTYNDLMIDAVTALAVRDAIVCNIPMMERYIHVSGSALVSSAMFKVRIGTRIGDIIEECGGFSAPPSKIVINGLLRGQAIYDLDTPITKYTKAVCVLAREQNPDSVSMSCTRCGCCISICPVGIEPMKLYHDFINRISGPGGRTFSTARLCTGCASCSCVCPARIPLYQIVSHIKNEFGEDGK